MRFQGKIFESVADGLWLAEVPAFDLMTQGGSRLDALEMLNNALTELVSSYLYRRTDFVIHSDGEAFTVHEKKGDTLSRLASLRRREKTGMMYRGANKEHP